MKQAFTIALVAAAFAAAACQPTTPQTAVQHHWGNQTWCANRIIQRESRWQPRAVNRTSRATGLFQIMPLHSKWIRNELGYTFNRMLEPGPNAHAARHLYLKAQRMYGDGWQPWRMNSRPIRGGGCPA